jgi:hypothetical protein
MSDEFVKRLALSCVLAAVSAPLPVAAQEPLGRLFFTPAQRTSLDIARTRRARATLSNERTEEAAPVTQTITYGGMVRRSDGKSTVWLNSRPVNDQEPVGGVSIVGRVRPDGSITLQVPQSGRSVNLKPGQSVELLSGAIEEAYSRKPVQPEPKPAAKPGAEAKPAAKPASPDRAAEERNREEREQQRVEEAVSRALQESAGAKPGAVPPSPPADRPR